MKYSQSQGNANFRIWTFILKKRILSHWDRKEIPDICNTTWINLLKTWTTVLLWSKVHWRLKWGSLTNPSNPLQHHSKMKSMCLRRRPPSGHTKWLIAFVHSTSFQETPLPSKLYVPLMYSLRKPYILPYSKSFRLRTRKVKSNITQRHFRIVCWFIFMVT